ncbi:MAG: hypothetical protein ABID38_06145 [Candidatus Diapherotrites archaeon]
MISNKSGIFFSTRDGGNPNKFAYLELMPTRVGGKPTHRLMVTFKTIGCSHGKCTHCELGENSFANITEKNLEKQMDSVLEELNRRNIPLESIGLVDLLTNGSFLDDKEVPSKVRGAIVRKAAESFKFAKKFVIDTRPEFVMGELVRPLVQELQKHGKKLEVSLGIDTTGWLNRKIVNKGYGFRALEKAFRTLTDCGADRMGYVLVKTPGQNEFEAIHTAVAAANKILSIGNRMDPKNPHGTTVSLEPIFVGKRTPLFKLFEEGRYSPAHLFSVADAVKRIKHRHPHNDVIIGLSSEGIASNLDREAHNRVGNEIDYASTRRARRNLTEFNSTQDLSLLDKILNENSASNRFWKNSIAKESIAARMKHFAAKLRILKDVRKYQSREKQFEHAQAGSRACTRNGAAAHAH